MRIKILLVAAALLLAGCTSAAPGTPIPAPTSTPVSQNGKTTAPPTSTLTALDPCTLLTSQARSELKGEATPEKIEFPSSRACQWNTTEVVDGYKFGFTIGIFPKLGLDKINSYSQKIDTTVNGRKAVRFTGAGGSGYSISLELTPTSRVDLVYVGREDDSMWARVQRLAELVEPELP
ncbi:DUF3558 domain-containing protein [Actinokineospora sp. G85]|uniref:DUF3558 domain-containing protein n=1 Tax=Actinokineospora sp. G85 TaxID=3406626 RepID=UPI003C766B32